jgi:hypothetical protein
MRVYKTEANKYGHRNQYANFHLAHNGLPAGLDHLRDHGIGALNILLFIDIAEPVK